MSTTRTRALELLGTGLSAETVANALGVTPSMISQLLAQEDFAAEVQHLRYQALQKHNKQDNEYDAIESELTAKMRDLLPMMHRPMEVLKAISVINGAKRRGVSAPEQITNQQTVLTLNMPVKIISQFTTNTANQVVALQSATEIKDLTTIQSGSLLKQTKDLLAVEAAQSQVMPSGGQNDQREAITLPALTGTHT